MQPLTFGPEFAGHPTSVDVRELKTFDPLQRAAAFRARMDAYYFKQVGAISSIRPWAPFPLAVMTCIGIETIGAYKYGDVRANRNRHFEQMAEQLDSGFSRLESQPGGKRKGNKITLSTFLYEGFRHSLAHGFYGNWVFITHDDAEAKTFKFDQADQLLVLNVYWFYERFRTVANQYLDDLTRATDVNLDPLKTFNKNFEEKFALWL